MNDEKQFEQFLMKGPVNIESVQRKVWSPEMIRLMKSVCSADEWLKLTIAHGHAEIGEGRGEWDDIAGQIRERLRSKER